VEDEALNTPPQDAPASLLAAFSEAADEADVGCAERAGALGRAEAGGAEWGLQAAEEGEDAGEEVKARGPGALLLRDVDLRGLEFSEQVGPSLPLPFLSQTLPPHTHTHTHTPTLSYYHRPPTYPAESILALPSQGVAFPSQGVAFLVHFIPLLDIHGCVCHDVCV
jgi:hypothetical protein